MQFACLTMRTIRGPSGLREAISQNWQQFLIRQHLLPAYLPSQETSALTLFEKIRPVLLILTGGNDICPLPHEKWTSDDCAAHRDATEFALIRAAVAERIPILGVCRGMHLLNTYFGGGISRDLSVRNEKEHVGKVHKVYFAKTSWTDALPSFEATTNSYHNHGVARGDLAAGFVQIAQSEDGVIEAFRHPDLPLVGIQWHPERPGTCSDHDQFILNKLLR